MSVKKFGNLPAAELNKLISSAKADNKNLAEEKKVYYKEYLNIVKDVDKEVNTNNRELKILLERLKEVKASTVIPHPTKFMAWGIRKVGKSFLFGCGKVRVNKTQLKTLLKIEAAITAQWMIEGIYAVHRQAYNFARMVSNGIYVERDNVGHFNVERIEVKGKTKYTFGCGAVVLSREEIALFYRIYSHINPYQSEAGFQKIRKDVITMAEKLLKSLN